jgi:hypothetical protein
MNRRDRLSTPTVVATDGQDSSVIILRERFARGEITKDQYDEMHQTLAIYIVNMLRRSVGGGVGWWLFFYCQAARQPRQRPFLPPTAPLQL